MGDNKFHMFKSFSAVCLATVCSTAQILTDEPTSPYMTQAPLPYALDALEPIMSSHQLDLHYNKHHAAYVSKFNKLVDQSDAARASGDFDTYTELTNQLKFNGGGALNHDFLWANLSPQHSQGGKGGKLPSEFSCLHKMVFDQWGSFNKLSEFVNTESAKLMGSGWAWLVYNKSTKALEYRQTEVHDRVDELNSDLKPLMCLDMWEHAFYVDYENRKTDYLAGIRSIVDWETVGDRLDLHFP